MELIRRHKRAFITIVIVFCFSVMGISATYRLNPTLVENWLGYIVTPVEGAFTRAVSWFSSKIDFFVNLSEIQSENERLKTLVDQLTADNIRLNIVEKDNDKLTALLNIRQQYADLPMIGAEITARDSGNWYNKYKINKGTNDGLAKDMVVIAAGGLAGRIYEAGETYAKVISLIDDQSSVSAKSDRTGDTGIVCGDIQLMMEGKCLMKFISDEADIRVGDTIVTGQLSSIYPPGIVIGTILDIENDPNGTKTATIQPYVDFKHMETVLVVTQLFEHATF